jgi:DnaD/phage-associated family protein
MVTMLQSSLPAETQHPAPVSPFPRGVQFTPVPNPLLAGLLEQIEDIHELKLTLRIIWALHRKKSPLPSVTAQELCKDRSVAAMFRASGKELEAAVAAALEAAVARGTLLEVPAGDGESGSRFLLNTDPVRRALERKGIQAVPVPGGPEAEMPQAEEQPGLSQGVFRVYEENIGPLTPLITESISAALHEHPEADIVDAIKVAVEHNARSWKYVTAVLRRWSVEGRDAREPDGKPERHSEENRSDEFIERYLERQRARGNQHPV